MLTRAKKQKIDNDERRGGSLESANVAATDVSEQQETMIATRCRIKPLPTTLNNKLTGLSKEDFATLRKKQIWLQKYNVEVPSDGAHLQESVSAVLVFAQEEAGTAVCISPEGLILTCAHCVAEAEDELAKDNKRWLLFASSRAVEVECTAWDDKRDLALLQVIGVQPDVSMGDSLPHVPIASRRPRLRTELICIGHPGSEDLEVSMPGVKTNYDVLFVSTGAFRGYAKGQNLEDNSEIGALMHDCWTYWGHSGAPLAERATGELIGLHSSWDDITGMRRGIPLEAIKSFLEIHAPEVLRRT